MYFYIYDSFLHSHRYQKVLNKIENRLHDLGINGRIGKLSRLKSLSEIIRSEYEAGIRNFIAVGHDQTLLDLINTAAELDVSIGYIPIGSDNYLAKVFGIPPEDLACDVLSARIVKKLDLGRINNYYFLGRVRILSNNITLHVHDGYSISPTYSQSEVSIVNLGDRSLSSKTHPDINVADHALNIVIREPLKKRKPIAKLFNKHSEPYSFFTVKELKVHSTENIKALVDNYKTFKLPINITTCPEQLKLIVGKNREVLT